MRLALIGPRGAGKTTVSGLLAQRTGLPAASTDAAVVERAGRSIEAIVRERGWSEFRELEKQVLRDIIGLHPTDLILDCGGGLILAQENRERLGFFEHIVYLYADPPVLVGRIGGDRKFRPPLTGEEDPLQEIRHVLARRDPIYRALCHLRIDTAVSSPWEIGDRIIAAFQIKIIEGEK
jgi:shikimate kinase